MRSVSNAQSLDVTIRPLKLGPTDYARYVRLHSLVEPDHPTTLEDAEKTIKGRDPKLEHAHYFAELDGEVVGYARYSQLRDRYHPQTFSLHVRTHPAWRRRGVGASLYQHLSEKLEPFSPLLFVSGATEDRPDALRFLKTRGFGEEARYFESRLDLATFNETPYTDLLRTVAEGPLDVRPLAEIMPGTPDYRQRMFDLDWQLTLDEPAPYEHTKPEPEAWIENYFEHPRFSPDSILIARDGDTWVGISELRLTPKEGVIGNWFTALHQNYRGQGIATAMKVRNILWAHEQGYREIRTDNNSLNRPMLNINERLGFIKQPAYIGFRKELRRAP